MRVEVPPGKCKTAYGGYPWSQLDEILPPDTVKSLEQWMYGQTMMICEGSPERKWVDDESAPDGWRLVEVGPSKCDRAHGVVVYGWDLERFLSSSLEARRAGEL